MSEYELHSLILLTIEGTHQAIGFWVLCTFGLVVARFVGGPDLRRSVVRIMAFFSLVLTVVLFGRLVLITSRELYYREALESLGHDPFPINPGAVGVMGMGYLMLTVLGAGAALYLILWHHRQPSA